MKLNEPVLEAGRIERCRPVFIAPAFSSGLAWKTVSGVAGDGSRPPNSFQVSIVGGSRQGLKCSAVEVPGNQYTRLWMIRWKL
jgi:hypothetical protein